MLLFSENVLIEVDLDDSGEGDDDVFGPYDIDGGIPYFGRIYNTLYVGFLEGNKDLRRTNHVTHLYLYFCRSQISLSKERGNMGMFN